MQCDDQMSIKVKFVRFNVSKHELLELSYHKSTILLMTISSSNLYHPNRNDTCKTSYTQIQ